jgi:glycine/D-amino acid oxidase-like deaminating enzyme
MDSKMRVAVIGGGILGLAHAYVLMRRGCRVTLFERSPAASGASIRNFGMIWPIGQPAGQMHSIAMRSREIWLEVLSQSRLPSLDTGSLHLAYRNDEAEVLREFAEIGPAAGYPCEWMNHEEVLQRSNAVNPENLRGGLLEHYRTNRRSQADRRRDGGISTLGGCGNSLRHGRAADRFAGG